jgi:hypothetical protein
MVEILQKSCGVKDMLRYKLQGNHEKPSRVVNPWSKASSHVNPGSATEEEGKEEHTCEVKPSKPMRTSIASQATFVGMTGEVLNSTMLERVLGKKANSG